MTETPTQMIKPFRPTIWTAVIGMADTGLTWFAANQWINGKIGISILAMVCGFVMTWLHTTAVGTDYAKWRRSLGDVPAVEVHKMPRGMQAAICTTLAEELNMIDNVLLDSGIDTLGAEGVRKLADRVRETESAS